MFYRFSSPYLVASGIDVDIEDLKIMVGDFVHVRNRADRVNLDVLLLVEVLDRSDNADI
jgi:hypothetical protein